MGSIQFEGVVVLDQMCLIKYKNMIQDDNNIGFGINELPFPGKFCIKG